VVDYVEHWTAKTEVTQGQLLGWAGLWSSTFCKWKRCYGKAFEHNAWIPRDHWLEDWEKQAIIQFHFDHPLNGYRRLTYMMMDAGVVATSPGTVYNVLKAAGLMTPARKRTRKGTGFDQPLAAHEHWHTDIAYLNIAGTFYFIASVLDGFSRSVIHWDIREKMEESDIEVILQAAKEKYPAARPRVISDNGPQFIAKDFKEFIRISGMTHVRTSPFYPQSNGKIERYHRSLKGECIRPGVPLCLEDAKRIVGLYVEEYNERRLHSALGYVTPKDMLAGRQQAIFEERDRKLEEARERRARTRAEQRVKTPEAQPASPATCYTAATQPKDRALLGSNPSVALMSKASVAAGESPPSLQLLAFDQYAINPGGLGAGPH
jgi:putative transposase